VKDDFLYHLPQFTMTQLPSPFAMFLKWSSWQGPDDTHCLLLLRDWSNL